MDPKFETKASKFLSFILRHNPAAGNLTLDAEGYADANDVLLALKNAGYEMSYDDLTGIVDRDEKQRYSFDVYGDALRANQGHSIVVDTLSPIQMVERGAKFYHGTSFHVLKDISYMGIDKMSRTHVHLSSDMATAIEVGKRHTKGKADYVAVLEIDAYEMFKHGHNLYLSDNDIILAEHVPPEFITAVHTSLVAFKD